VILSNEVECDEAYVVAGHKGQPEVVKSKEKPPVFGMIERGGQVVMHLSRPAAPPQRLRVCQRVEAGL
jgi:hypothetical protein